MDVRQKPSDQERKCIHKCQGQQIAEKAASITILGPSTMNLLDSLSRAMHYIVGQVVLHFGFIEFLKTRKLYIKCEIAE